MNTDLYYMLVMVALFAVGVAAGYGYGFIQGKDEGFRLGRSVARQNFWSE